MRERRHHARPTLRLNVSYEVEGTKQVGTVLTRDANAIGMRFVSQHPLEAGTHLKCTLRLPDRATPLSCTGRVVWSRSVQTVDVAKLGGMREVGVEFIDMATADWVLLQQCMEMHGSSPNE